MNYCMGSAWTSFKLAAPISQSSLSIKRTVGGIVQPTVSWNTTTTEMQPMFLWPKDWNSPVVNGKHPEGDWRWDVGKYILFNHGWKSTGRHRGSSFIQHRKLYLICSSPSKMRPHFGWHGVMHIYTMHTADITTKGAITTVWINEKWLNTCRNKCNKTWHIPAAQETEILYQMIKNIHTSLWIRTCFKSSQRESHNHLSS